MMKFLNAIMPILIGGNLFFGLYHLLGDRDPVTTAVSLTLAATLALQYLKEDPHAGE